jgi:hypothetical protein
MARRKTFTFVLLLAGLVAAGRASAQIANGDTDAERCRDPRLLNSPPFAAACFLRSRLVDEKGVIAPDGRQRGFEQLQKMRAWKGLPPLGGGIGGAGSWTQIGPGNIGGRIRSVVRHPTAANTMWIGAVGGGVFLTTDGGSTWSASNDFIANIAVSSLVLDPTDVTSNTLYAGTGEGFYNFDAIRGAGIYKTANGQSAGASWTQVTGTGNSNFTYVNRLALSASGAALLSATTTGLWLAPSTAAPAWTRMISAGSVADVKLNPADNTKAVAGGYGQAWYVSAGDARTTGATWTASTFSPAISSTAFYLGRVELAYAPSDPTIVYASVDESTSSGQGWFYKSTNGGQLFTRVNSGTNLLGGQGWYDNVVFVSPTDPALVVVGGTQLWTSTNSGTTFVSLGYRGGGIHPDNHSIVPDPQFNGTTNKIGFVGNDGGIYKVTDITAPTGPVGTSLNTNLPITQFWAGAAHNATGYVTGGTQDNGTPGTTTGALNTWVDWTGGDGGYAATDWTNALGQIWYGEYTYLQISRRLNGFTPYATGITGGGVSCGGGGGALADAGVNANFMAPFILDPNNANRLLGGGASLWLSANPAAATPCWAAIKASTGSSISAIAVKQGVGGSDVIWVGHNNGSVYKTVNGTNASPTWNQVGSGTLPSGRVVTKIAIEPTDANVVYVAYGGYSANNLWRTTDAGATAGNWTNITGTIPAVPLYALAINPSHPGWLYVGSDVGIFDSQNASAGTPTWSANDGPSNAQVFDLFWASPIGSNLTLYAATHGRSMWKTTSPTPVNLLGFEVK